MADLTHRLFCSKIIKALQICLFFFAKNGIHCYHLQSHTKFTNIMHYQLMNALSTYHLQANLSNDRRII